MGIMDKFLDIMRLNDDDDDDDYEYENEEYEYEEEEVKKPSRRERKKEEQEQRAANNFEVSKPKQQGKITPISKNRKQGQLGMEVCVIKPTTVEDSREIADTLLSERAVVLNLEGIDVELAQRIIDFTSGACFAIDGKLKKISNYIFIATPSAISISGDLLELFGTSGINGDSVSYNADTTTF